MSWDHRDGSAITFSCLLSNQNLNPSLALLKLEVKKQDFSLQGNRWRPFINLNSWIFTLEGCCRLLEAKKFPRNQGQFKWGARETRYHVSIVEILNRISWAKLQNYSEDLGSCSKCFVSLGPPIFPKLTEDENFLRPG